MELHWTLVPRLKLCSTTDISSPLSSLCCWPLSFSPAPLFLNLFFFFINGRLILDEQSWWSGASGMSWQQRIKYKSKAPGGSGEGGGRWEGPGVSEEIGFFRSSRWCWPTTGGVKVRKWRHERRSSCWVAPIYSYQRASLLDRCHIKFCTLELPSEGLRRCSAVQNTSQSGLLEGKASKERVEFNKAAHLGGSSVMVKVTDVSLKSEDPIWVLLSPSFTFNVPVLSSSSSRVNNRLFRHRGNVAGSVSS